MKFKVKYKNKDGEVVEVEISVSLGTLLDQFSAAKQLGIAPSNIISIKKI